MIKTGKYLLVIVLSAMLILSCTQERMPCLTPKTASLNVKTVRVNSGSVALDTPMPSALFVPFTGSVLTGIIYPQTASFTLSLSPLADTCLWAFAPDTAAGSMFDTITLRYNRQLQFVSNACGYSYFYNLLSVQSTNHSIDSILITNTSVTNDVKKSHLQVYIHPQP
ncbi:MAG: hypothetical protein K9G49_15265 [Taibaiella sp.]|jgi:hypothetical protein|nr:hypothetical protein [Taibaiella sp.]